MRESLSVKSRDHVAMGIRLRKGYGGQARESVFAESSAFRETYAADNTADNREHWPAQGLPRTGVRTWEVARLFGWRFTSKEPRNAETA